MAYEITKDDEFLRVVHLDGKWYAMYLPNAPLDFHLIEPVFYEEVNGRVSGEGPAVRAPIKTDTATNAW